MLLTIASMSFRGIAVTWGWPGVTGVAAGAGDEAVAAGAALGAAGSGGSASAIKRCSIS